MGGVVDAIFGGSSQPSAPAPDPNIGIAAQQNAAVAQAALDFNKQMYEDQKPRQAAMDTLSTQLINNYITSQNQNQALATDYQNRMQHTFYPVEDSLVSDAMNYNTPAMIDQQAGLARADVSNSYNAQRQALQRQQQSAGIDPTSGTAMSLNNDLGISQAAAEAAAMTRARDAAVQLGWSKKMDAASLGRGLPSSQATSSQIALSANNGAQGAAQAPISSALGIQSGMNQGYGTAMSGWNSVGNLGLGASQIAQSGWNAQQQADAQNAAGFGNFLGTIGAAAIKNPGGISALASAF